MGIKVQYKTYMELKLNIKEHPYPAHCNMIFTLRLKIDTCFHSDLFAVNQAAWHDYLNTYVTD